MTEKQSYLITGATGFIGQHLCRHLSNCQAGVIALSRRPRRARRLLKNRARVVSSLSEIAEDETIHGIINLAGEPLLSGRWSDRKKRRFISSRVGMTESLVDWLASREQRPAVMISGSAIGYYGDQQAKIVSELEEPHAGFAHTLCNAWEQAALKAESLGVRVCLLRTGIVLGRNGGTLKKMLPVFRLGLGGPLGSGRQWMSWIHIDDLISLIDFLLSHQTLSGPFNGTAPQPVTNLQFVHALGRHLHRPALLPVPGFSLHLLFGEMADELLLCSQRIVPGAVMEAGFEFQYPELEVALADLLG